VKTLETQPFSCSLQARKELEKEGIFDKCDALGFFSRKKRAWKQEWEV
jgi:hypothetical protein